MGTNGIWLKSLSVRIPVWEIVGLRFVLTLLGVSILARLLKKSTRTSQIKLQLILGLCGGILILSYFLAIDALGLSVATILLYTAPVFGTVISHFFLKERMGKSQVIGMTLSFAGMILVLKPVSLSGSYAGIGLLAGMMYGLKMVLNRKLGETDSTWAITFYYMLVPSVLFVAYLSIAGHTAVWPISTDVLPLAGLVLVASVAGLLLQHYGASHVPVSESSVILMLEAVAATMFGVVLFNEALETRTIVGAAMIVASGAYLNRFGR
jgi:drug/metabolite transporter (DMT)-like permease